MSKAKLNFEAVCPYCKTNHKFSFRVDVVPFCSQKHVIYCDTEEGGCDEYFVVFLSADVNVVSYGLDFKKSVGNP